MKKKSHAAVPTSDSPTSAQLKELHSQIESGRITKDSLQGFLRGGAKQEPMVLIVSDLEESKESKKMNPQEEYWDKVFPGAGRSVASVFDALNRLPENEEEGDRGDGLMTLVLGDCCDDEEVEKLAVFWRKEKPEVRYITPDQVKSVSVKGYRVEVEEFLCEELKDMWDHINFPGDLLRYFHCALGAAHEECPNWPADRDLQDWFLRQLPPEFAYADVVEQESEATNPLWETVAENFYASFFAEMVSKFLGAKVAEGAACLTVFWEEGNWPLGFDDDGKFVILHRG